jgi:tetratricopeptide (TPR) repeat protein
VVTAEPTGSLEVALAHARRLLERRPALAEGQAKAILEAVPGHPVALLLLARARRLQGDAAGARAMLTPLVAAQPRWAEAQNELGLALTALGEGDAAAAALRAGGAEGAGPLMQAAAAMVADDLPAAEALLREHLAAFPTDAAAMRMLAEIETRFERHAEAEALLERCLALAPDFLAARHNYAVVLNRQNKPVELMAEVDRLLAAEPANPAFRALKAAALARLGEAAGAIAVYEPLLAEFPDHSKIRLSYGHALKTEGRTQDAIAAYEHCLARNPGFGEAYWSLANLKTYRFTAERLAEMQAQAARDDLGAEDRLHLEFALGKALEDRAEWAEAFTHYARGAKIRRAQIPYDAGDLTRLVERCRARLTPAFFAARAGWGARAPDPIFIVGLPRSGSTLIEQILSSHSRVEGTQELPEITALSRQLGPGGGEAPEAYPGVLADLDDDQARRFGEAYLARTRAYRKTDRPFFIDKMPNNFAHIGLIHLILPNAKIIDARRHPMAAGFSSFKQHFAAGQRFSYDLADIGRYYRDYAELMDHFDAVLPGRVHRVNYETLVEDTETEVHRLLDHCGLPFEAGCLRFHETARAVRTASSEQVRRPIFRDGLDQWRNFAPYLEPLATALGPILQAYPQSPDRGARRLDPPAPAFARSRPDIHSDQRNLQGVPS